MQLFAFLKVFFPSVISFKILFSLDNDVLLRYEFEGWRDDSAVKSTGCSSRGPKFNFQQPHGGSHPSVVRSGVLFWPADIHEGRTLYT